MIKTMFFLVVFFKLVSTCTLHVLEHQTTLSYPDNLLRTLYVIDSLLAKVQNQCFLPNLTTYLT